MDIRLITVAGGGVMGRQIALNAAIHGFDAVLYDISADVLD
ncbi:MAG: 3-hydroxyacyl-CoA dehydrogenase, partial [Firmicutes bacterium]|nr:3-hydroxyacyl-CoA dehydrogenase [Bacillota bacterium]